MRDKEFVEDLKQKYIKLVNENNKLRKRIAELEKEKDENISNIIEEKIHKSFNDLLRDYKCPKDDRYKPYLDDDWSYDPERDGLDWSYKPKRGTDGHPYTWPYVPEVGDWPPGPQVGDWPPGTVPPGYPYWSIYPPCWPYYPSYRNVVKSNTTNADDLCPPPHTVSKTDEKIER